MYRDKLLMRKSTINSSTLPQIFTKPQAEFYTLDFLNKKLKEELIKREF